MRRSLLALALIGCDGSIGPSEPAATVEVIAGAGQRAAVGTELPQAVVVRLTDEEGRAVPRHPVSFVVVEGDGSVVAGSDRTDANGEAQARWTLGPFAGEQVVEARAMNQQTGEPIVISPLTATADPGPVVSLSAQNPAFTMFLGDSVDASQAVTALDAFGNLVHEAEFLVSAPATFAVEGNIVTPLQETTGRVMVSTGSLEATFELTVIRNLTDLVGARGSYACAGRLQTKLGDDDEDVTVIRQEASFVVDSVFLSPGWREGGGLQTTSTVTYTLEDGTERTFEDVFGVTVVWWQDPLVLDLKDPVGEATAVSQAPLTYLGGANCPEWQEVTSYEPWSLIQE